MARGSEVWAHPAMPTIKNEAPAILSDERNHMMRM